MKHSSISQPENSFFFKEFTWRLIGSYRPESTGVFGTTSKAEKWSMVTTIQIAVSPLAAADVAFCDTHFIQAGRLIDLGCGTGRLAAHFARKGFEYVGVDLSEEMLIRARANALSAGVSAEFQTANLVDLAGIPDASFDYAACLFSTLGMVRGDDNRRAALVAATRVVKPGGRLVLHAHNRWFRGLGWRRCRTAEFTMPQAYGGAPLTLRHFTRREIHRLLETTGCA